MFSENGMHVMDFVSTFYIPINCDNYKIIRLIIRFNSISGWKLETS